ncbi:MAG TPA: hypothetical protein VFF49_11215 [Thermodesulfobacteriota bacterium]|nr:hypothetical protein [Thermodesulfobacteriota bacterium]
MKKEFIKKFVKPFQNNKDFNEMQLGAIEIRDHMMFDWFDQKLKEREKEVIEKIKDKLLGESLTGEDALLDDLAEEAVFKVLDEILNSNSQK